MSRVLVLMVGCALGLAAASEPPGAHVRELQCRLLEGESRPEVGTGCHLQWEEEQPDGTWVETVARVRCEQSVVVCGEEVWCRCPRTQRRVRQGD